MLLKTVSQDVKLLQPTNKLMFLFLTNQDLGIVANVCKKYLLHGTYAEMR